MLYLVFLLVTATVLHMSYAMSNCLREEALPILTHFNVFLYESPWSLSFCKCIKSSCLFSLLLLPIGNLFLNSYENILLGKTKPNKTTTEKETWTHLIFTSVAIWSLKKGYVLYRLKYLVLKNFGTFLNINIILN